MCITIRLCCKEMYIVGGLIQWCWACRCIEIKITESHLACITTNLYIFHQGFSYQHNEPECVLLVRRITERAVNTYQNQAPFYLLHFFVHQRWCSAQTF